MTYNAIEHILSCNHFWGGGGYSIRKPRRCKGPVLSFAHITFVYSHNEHNGVTERKKIYNV